MIRSCRVCPLPPQPSPPRPTRGLATKCVEGLGAPAQIPGEKRGREAGAHLGFTHSVPGLQILREQSGLVPAPVWDAGAADGGLTHCAPAPAPRSFETECWDGTSSVQTHLSSSRPLFSPGPHPLCWGTPEQVDVAGSSPFLAFRMTILSKKGL